MHKITPELIEQAIRFHGHVCPGLGIGIRVSEIALEFIGHNDNGGVVSVTETDMCGVDAIQFLTGCTYGKGNLIHLDFGKMAFSFYSRAEEKAIRVVLVPEALKEIQSKLGSNSPGESVSKDQNQKIREKQFEYILHADIDTLFTRMASRPGGIPRRAKSLASMTCQMCGEGVMESRVRLYDDQMLCVPCFQTVEQKI